MKKRSKTRVRCVGGMPGPSSRMLHAAVAVDLLDRDRDRAAVRRKADRVVDEIVEDLREAFGSGADARGLGGRRPPRAGGVDRDRHAALRAQAMGFGDVRQDGAHVDAGRRLAFELRVDGRDFAHAGEQAFEAIDIAAHHREKAFALRGIFDRRHHLGDRADRRQRILELVRHIGGKRFDESQVFVETARQFVERASEVADFVEAR